MITDLTGAPFFIEICRTDDIIKVKLMRMMRGYPCGTASEIGRQDA